MKKHLFLLASLLSLALAGCGNTSSTSATSSTSSTAPTSSLTSSSVAASSEAPISSEAPASSETPVTSESLLSSEEESEISSVVEGATITFAHDDTVQIYVYPGKDYTVEPTLADTYFGAYDEGETSVNFKVVCADGYEVETVSATAGLYNSIKYPSDTGAENVYRVTKITGDLTVTVTTKSTTAEDTGYTVNFTHDANVSVYVFETQDYTMEGTASDVAYSRDSDTGALTKSGDGQVNFKVVCADGYEADAVTVTSGAYKAVKGPSDTGSDNCYRITKIASDLEVSVTSKVKSEETEPETIDAYSVTFVHDANVSIYLYDVSGFTGDGTLSDLGYSLNKDTGAYDKTGEGQINFRIAVADNYSYSFSESDITGSFNKLKGPTDTGSDDCYRITKIASDLTVTITSSAITAD